MNMRMRLLAVSMTAFGVSPAWAQTDMTTMPMTTDGAMPAMDHGSMNHGAMPAMDHSTMPDMPVVQPEMKHDMSGSMEGMQGMDHGNTPAPQQAMEDMNQGGSTMDHGEMNMQGGAAPADARDPHAYSGGYTLESGPYARPGPRELRLDDEHNFGALLVDRLERGYSRDSNHTAYDMQAWFGRDYDRLVIKAEGDIAGGQLQEARTELLWGHAIATFWDAQAGVRYDSGVGPDRGWLALGVQGLAPYWFEVDAAAYLGDNGRTALRLGAEYEVLLTQKLVLQPRVEVNWYGRSDEARGIGAGLSEAQAGLRLRYEFTRQFAPYIGVERSSTFGRTADLAREEGESTGVTRWVAGVRFWF